MAHRPDLWEKIFKKTQPANVDLKKTVPSAIFFLNAWRVAFTSAKVEFAITAVLLVFNALLHWVCTNIYIYIFYTFVTSGKGGSCCSSPCYNSNCHSLPSHHRVQCTRCDYYIDCGLLQWPIGYRICILYWSKINQKTLPGVQIQVITVIKQKEKYTLYMQYIYV